MKHKKSQTGNVIMRWVLYLSLAALVIWGIFGPLQDLMDWTGETFGRGNTCKETGLSLSEYNKMIVEKLYISNAEETIPIVLEFVITCSFNIEDLVIDGSQARLKSVELAEALCEQDHVNLAMSIYEGIYSENKGDQYERCKQRRDFHFTEGCTDFYAINYDPYAGIDDGSCTFPDLPFCEDACPITEFPCQIKDHEDLIESAPEYYSSLFTATDNWYVVGDGHPIYLMDGKLVTEEECIATTCGDGEIDLTIYEVCDTNIDYDSNSIYFSNFDVNYQDGALGVHFKTNDDSARYNCFEISNLNSIFNDHLGISFNLECSEDCESINIKIKNNNDEEINPFTYFGYKDSKFQITLNDDYGENMVKFPTEERGWSNYDGWIEEPNSYELKVDFYKNTPWNDYWEISVPNSDSKLKLNYFTTQNNGCFSNLIKDAHLLN